MSLSTILGTLRSGIEYDHNVYFSPEDQEVLLHALRGYRKELEEVEQILGKALGYPWFKDDQENFPGATEKDGVAVGDHTAASLAQEAANKIARLADVYRRMTS